MDLSSEDIASDALWPDLAEVVGVERAPVGGAVNGLERNVYGFLLRRRVRLLPTTKARRRKKSGKRWRTGG